MTYTVSSGTLNSTIPYHTVWGRLCETVEDVPDELYVGLGRSAFDVELAPYEINIIIIIIIGMRSIECRSSLSLLSF